MRWPKVVGSAWMPCVRPTLTVSLCSQAEVAQRRDEGVALGQQDVGGVDQLQRERGVEQVAARHAEVDVGGGLARLGVVGPGRQERDDVVLRDGLDLGDGLGGGRGGAGAPARRCRRARRRPRRAPRARAPRPGTRARTCGPRSRPGPSRAACSARSRRCSSGLVGRSGQSPGALRSQPAESSAAIAATSSPCSCRAPPTGRARPARPAARSSAPSAASGSTTSSSRTPRAV